MKRIGILTAGGDTPALNATIYGAVIRACERRVEVIGLLNGFSSLFDPRCPHVRLNPLFGPIPELDPTMGGTVLGSSRTYVDHEDAAGLDHCDKVLKKLRLDGLICIGGDGTINGLQPLCDRLPTVLAPKTIDNDLGLNYSSEANHWVRDPDPSMAEGYSYRLDSMYAMSRGDHFDLDQIINYVTPGYATAVFVSADGVRRVRTTAESHRRIAIIEVMGRHSGYIALGSSYGQPDITLVPEAPLCLDLLTERVREIYDLQKNLVIVCGEGITAADGTTLGGSQQSTDPAGNMMLSGAAESLRQMLVARIGDEFFQQQAGHASAETAIFTRKVGHTQRGGRPLLFDRFHAAQLGGKATEMLLAGENNCVATLQYNSQVGFHYESFNANRFRDKWGVIHARQLHPRFYDAERMRISRTGLEYLLPIFTTAIGDDDTEYIRQSLFDAGNLYRPYHSINMDIQRRTEYL